VLLQVSGAAANTFSPLGFMRGPGGATVRPRHLAFAALGGDDASGSLLACSWSDGTVTVWPLVYDAQPRK